MSKEISINTTYNGRKYDNCISYSSMNRNYTNENYNNPVTQLSLPTESFHKSESPLFLKRSSLIHYNDNIQLYVNNHDNHHIGRDVIDYELETIKKPSFPSLFPTASISSLTEECKSSEYTEASQSNQRSQSTSCRPRFPITTTNGNHVNNVTSSATQSSAPSSSVAVAPLSLTSDKGILASCLSKCDASSQSVAKDIMRLMDFTDMSLVESLQYFIKKIPVMGESQERDRILTHFTNRYMECNPTAFKHNDSCHTLVCALMLLNTDIHGQVSKKRMTCGEFVDNILINYPDNDYKENDLITVYNFIRKTELKNEDASDNGNTLRRKFSKLITKSIRPVQELGAINIDPNLLNQQHFISGNIMRKCIKRSFGKKPGLGHRGWKLQFASLIGLQLLLFKTNLNKSDGRANRDDCSGDRISLTDSNISSELLHNDDASLSMSVNNPTKSINLRLPSSCSSENIQVSVDDVECCLKIHHSFATVVEKLRYKNVFCLRLADQAEYFFKVKSDQLHTWINSINYAAAILSAPPIIGAGQSGLYKPLLPGYLSECDKIKQVQSHETQIRNYMESLKTLHFVNSKTRVINEPHIQFCKYEITRFETYLKLLRPQSLEEYQNIQSSMPPNVTSMRAISKPRLSESNCSHTESPRSIFSASHHFSDSSSQDMSTLCRRPSPPHPNKVPTVPSSNSISRTANPSSNYTHRANHIQLSPTADSLHSCAIPQCYVPLSKKLTLYSPQIGSHLQYPHSIGARPMQSFSRFIEPSIANNYYRQSPLAIDRSQHRCQPSFVALPNNKLPQYSPPGSRYNYNKT